MRGETLYSLENPLHVDRGQAQVDNSFWRVTISMLAASILNAAL